MACLFGIPIFRLLASELRVVSFNPNKKEFLSEFTLNAKRIRIEFRQRIQLHNWFTILETLCWNVTTLFAPFILVLGLFILMVGNYGTIKMYDKIDPLMYPLFPVVSIIALVQTSILLPAVCQLNDQSIQFLKLIRVQALGKFEVKQLRAIRPLRFKIASFFYCKSRTEILYMEVVTSHTINALLLF